MGAVMASYGNGWTHHTATERPAPPPSPPNMEVRLHSTRNRAESSHLGGNPLFRGRHGLMWDGQRLEAPCRCTTPPLRPRDPEAHLHSTRNRAESSHLGGNVARSRPLRGQFGMGNAPQLPHRPAPPPGTVEHGILPHPTENHKKHSYDLGWPRNGLGSLWKVRGDVGGRVVGKKKCARCVLPGNRTNPRVSSRFSQSVGL